MLYDINNEISINEINYIDSLTIDIEIEENRINDYSIHRMEIYNDLLDSVKVYNDETLSFEQWKLVKPLIDKYIKNNHDEIIEELKQEFEYREQFELNYNNQY